MAAPLLDQSSQGLTTEDAICNWHLAAITARKASTASRPKPRLPRDASFGPLCSMAAVAAGTEQPRWTRSRPLSAKYGFRSLLVGNPHNRFVQWMLEEAAADEVFAAGHA